jgi:transposase-like protein
MSNSKISDECPHCKRPFEIVAVDLSLLRGNVALFVCPDCGMTRPETADEARRKPRRRRILALPFWLSLSARRNPAR